MDKDFIPATNKMLQQAAAGELVLFAPARRHTAKLHAFPWAVAPKQSHRSCAADHVPIMPELAKELLCFPEAQLKSYLAIDPTDCAESHPLEDHFWVLDEPQTITREQIYFQSAPAAAKVEAGAVTTPAPAVQPDETDYDEILAALFNPVTVEELEKTFPANGRWKNWAERAARNGLKDAAKEVRGQFNPYKAAVWFVNQGVAGWDLAHCYRVLANNLPARSLYNKHLLTGDID